MKTLWLLSLLAFAPGGERERGLQLYREGRFAEAAAAFQKALVEDGDSAELQWNLALAAWRAGDLTTAETAAEKYAALDRNARVDLHAGLLGAVRHDEALALAGKADSLGAPAAPVPAVPADPAGAPPSTPPDPLPVLEEALNKATQARDHFVRGVTANATPELLRNTERALRTIDELQKKIDELKKQREQQKQDDKSENKDDKSEDKKDEKQDPGKDEPKKDESGKQDDKQDESKADDKKSEEKKSEDAKDQPKPGEGEEKPEPKPQQGQDQQPGKEQQPPQDQGQEPKPGEKRQDAPGEQAEGRQLTPEQTQRLLEQLRELDDKQKQIRARAKTARRAVERDW